MSKYRKYKRQCPVLGCNSATTDGMKFFRFPENGKESTKLWNVFTNVKDFKPIPSEVMCELHFAPENIAVNKNGKKYLRKNTVPTIFFKDGQKITVQYDASTHQYIGYGAELMMQEVEERELDKEKKMIELRYEKVKEIKNLCRFCFSNEKNAKCIAMSKLQAYSIDPYEMISILGIDQQYHEAFNEIICVDCFDKIIEFYNYRNKCQKNQKELILSMQEIDRKILEIQQVQRFQNDTFTDWMKVEIKHNETEQFEDDFYDVSHDDDHFMDADYSSENIVKTENETENIEEVEVQAEPENQNVDDGKKTRKRKLCSKEKAKSKTIQSTPRSAKKLPKSSPKINSSTPSEGSSTKQSYECFFCRNKYIGKKVYRSHACEVKRVKCEIEDCDSYFVNQGGYNVHLQRRHKMPKVSRHFCPVCRTHFQKSSAKFDEHCRKCSEEHKYKEQAIQCEKCKKVFNNLQTFTAHRMFHDAEDLTKINIPSVEAIKNKKSSTEICDLCGKVFVDSVGALRRHQVNVHFTEFTGKMFQCDLCPIAKPTKPLLYSHMKSTHIIRWHTCEICGKIFRNRELWRKHQLVHGDYKKNNRCEVCAHQPGFVTASALKKHLARHHGGAEPVRKFICDVPNCRAAYSRDDQLIRHKVNVHQIYHNNYNETIIRHYVNS